MLLITLGDTFLNRLSALEVQSYQFMYRSLSTCIMYVSIFPSIRLPSLVRGRNHRMRRHLLPEGTVSAS